MAVVHMCMAATLWLYKVSAESPLPSPHTNISACVDDSVQKSLFTRPRFGINKKITLTKVCSSNDDTIFIKTIDIIFPYKKDYQYKQPSALTHKKKANTTCLQEKHAVLFDDIIKRFFHLMSGQSISDTSQHLLKTQEVYLNPQPDWLFVSYICTDESSLVRNVLDRPNISSVPKENFVEFKSDNISYCAGLAGASCFCRISSGNNESSLSLTAYDVRLAEGMTLTFDGCVEGQRSISDERVHWLLDGELCVAESSEINITLTMEMIGEYNLWLKITGEALSISCGEKPEEPINPREKKITGHTQESELGLVVLICIIVGSILVLAIIAVVVGCCIKRQRQSRTSEITSEEKKDLRKFELRGRAGSDLPPLPEVIYSEPNRPHPSLTTEHVTLIREPNYFEIENTYEEPGDPTRRLPNNNNKKPRSGSLVSERIKKFNNQDAANQRPASRNSNIPGSLGRPSRSRNDSQTEAIYNHLREQPDVVPNNVYDTTVRGEYSSFRRNDQNRTIPDTNIYH